MSYEKEERKICVICGKGFDFWHSKAKTCGKECSSIHEKNVKRLYSLNNKEKIRESAKRYYEKNRKPVIKKCKICGNDFIAKGCLRTCSQKCSKENSRRNSNRNSKLWVARHPEKRKEICKRYSRENSKILNEKSRKWHREHKERGAESTKRWRKDNKKKRNAEALAQYSIKIPENAACELCKSKNNRRLERHHTDYDKPLEVAILCTKCHSRVHADKIKIKGTNYGKKK